MTNDAQQPDKDAMMAQWAKYAMPGSHHELFKRLAGKWTATLSMWMAPGALKEEFAGDTEFTLIFGGRYLRQTWTSEWMGQPFEGFSLTGFDMFRQEFSHLWIDNMGTAMTFSHGKPDASGKVITYAALMDDPINERKDVPLKMTDTIVDDDTQRVEMFTTAPNGTEYKNMEIVYKRKK